jgi:hypothetical protein
MPKSYDPESFGGSHHKAGEPSGAIWVALRARLWRTLTNNGAHKATCYACGHEILPGLGECQHLLSPSSHPQLALAESNLRPIHGGGRRRCPTCRLSCNSLSAGNLAVRDDSGRPLPFTDAFIAAAQERTGTSRGNPRPAAQEKATAEFPQSQKREEGRDWDLMARERDAEQGKVAPGPDLAVLEPRENATEPVAPGSPEWFMQNAPEWK